MEPITVTPMDTTKIARFVLTQPLTKIKMERRASWPQDACRLKKSLDEYLNPISKLPGESIIDQIERSVCSLRNHTRWAITQLDEQTQQQLATYLKSKN